MSYPIKNNFNKELLEKLTSHYTKLLKQLCYIQNRLSKLTFNFTYLSTDENDDNLYEYLVLDKYENNNIIVNMLNKEYKVDILKNIKFCAERNCNRHFLNYTWDNEIPYMYDQFAKYIEIDEKTFGIIMNVYLSSIDEEYSYKKYMDINFGKKNIKGDNKEKNNVIDEDTFFKLMKVIKSKLYYSDEIENLNNHSSFHCCYSNDKVRGKINYNIYCSDILSITNK